jgi:hypothetical protein
MNPIIQIDEVDTLTMKKINFLTDTPEKIIKFLQDLKLLGILPTTVEACGALESEGEGVRVSLATKTRFDFV